MGLPVQTLPASLARAALDLAENMVVVTDRSGTILYVNEAFTTVTGYAAAEVVGETPAVLRSGVQDDVFYEALWGRILSGRRWDGELVNRRRDGTLYTDRMTITPLVDAAGEVVHFVAVKRDVSGHVAALTAGSPAGAAHLDARGRLVYANARLEQMLGRGFERLLGMGWMDTMTPQDAAMMARTVRAAASHGQGDVLVVEPLAGGVLRVHLAGLAVGSPDQPAGVVASFEDVTNEEQARRELQYREEHTRAILDSLASPTAVVDAAGAIHTVNRAWDQAATAHGADPAATGVGASYLAVCDRSRHAGCEQAGAALDALRRALAGDPAPPTVDYEIGDGSWWELRVTPLRAGRGGAVLAHTDITQRHALQALLHEQATTDPLTGLWNRAGLADHAPVMLARARRSGRPVTVLFVDLDRFKPINDTHGHQAGDLVLQACGRRLRSCVRETDLVARVGGDEFVVICEDLADDDSTALAARIRGSLHAPVELAHGEVTVGASVGVLHTPVSGDTTLEGLLAEADAAMYVAKRAR